MNRMNNKLRQRFLMPCRLTSGVKKALDEYAQAKREMISRYTLNPSAKGVYISGARYQFTKNAGGQYAIVAWSSTGLTWPEMSASPEPLGSRRGLPSSPDSQVHL